MSAYILYVCIEFSTFWNACSRNIRIEFPTKAECQESLAQFKFQPSFSFGYCEPKKPSEQEKKKP